MTLKVACEIYLSITTLQFSCKLENLFTNWPNISLSHFYFTAKYISGSSVILVPNKTNQPTKNIFVKFNSEKIMLEREYVKYVNQVNNSREEVKLNYWCAFNTKKNEIKPIDLNSKQTKFEIFHLFLIKKSWMKKIKVPNDFIPSNMFYLGERVVDDGQPEDIF